MVAWKRHYLWSVSLIMNQFSPNSLDLLCLQVAQVPRSQNNICVHHDINDDDTTDYFTPCICTQGNNASSISDYQSYFLQGKASKVVRKTPL